MFLHGIPVIRTERLGKKCFLLLDKFQLLGQTFPNGMTDADLLKGL